MKTVIVDQNKKKTWRRASKPRGTLTFGGLTLSHQECSSPVLQAEQQPLGVPAGNFAKVPPDGVRERDKCGTRKTKLVMGKRAEVGGSDRTQWARVVAEVFP